MQFRLPYTIPGIMFAKRLLYSLVFFIAAASVQVHAWGCEGHEIVALIAMKHLTPQVATQVNAILNASPIAATMRHYCRNSGLPLVAEVATWADDVRSEQPDTAPLHFINIPLFATRDKYDAAKACDPTCITDAIAKFQRQLKTSSDAKARADALRFLIHFVGDINQPLHDEDNSDQGGNCVPLEYEDETPRVTNAQHEDYFPNLHSIWDTGMIQTLLAEHDMTLEEFADFLDHRYKPRLERWKTGQPLDWAWEGHDLAVTAYRALPAYVPKEPDSKVASCADNNHIAKRTAELQIVLGQRYEHVSHPIVEEQLTKAGVRLAGLLNSTLGK
jgi:hypothetical protein